MSDFAETVETSNKFEPKEHKEEIINTFDTDESIEKFDNSSVSEISKSENNSILREFNTDYTEKFGKPYFNSSETDFETRFLKMQENVKNNAEKLTSPDIDADAKKVMEWEKSTFEEISESLRKTREPNQVDEQVYTVPNNINKDMCKSFLCSIDLPAFFNAKTEEEKKAAITFSTSSETLQDKESIHFIAPKFANKEEFLSSITSTVDNMDNPFIKNYIQTHIQPILQDKLSKEDVITFIPGNISENDKAQFEKISLLTSINNQSNMEELLSKSYIKTYDAFHPANTEDDKLNKQTIDLLVKNKHPLQKNQDTVPYFKNPFDDSIHTAENQYRIHTSNAEKNAPVTINYSFVININAKGIKTPKANKEWGTVGFEGIDPVTGQKKYSVLIPTKGMKEKEFQKIDSVAEQQPIPSFIPQKFVTESTSPMDVMTLKTAEMLNSAFTKHPYSSQGISSEAIQSVIGNIISHGNEYVSQLVQEADKISKGLVPVEQARLPSKSIEIDAPIKKQEQSNSRGSRR